MTARPSLTVLLGLLALLLLWSFCLRYHRPGIEADLESRVHDALVEQGMGEIEVGADGRVLRLEGSVASAAERTRLTGIARAVYGVRAIDDQLRVGELALRPKPLKPPELPPERAAEPPVPAGVIPVPTHTPYRTGLDLDEHGRIRLTGSVPDEAGRGTLRSLAGARAPGGRVHDGLSVRRDAPEGWAIVMGAVGKSLDRFETVNVSLVDHQLTVTGTARSPNARDAAVGEIRRALPRGFDASLDIATPGVACQQRFDAALASARIRFASSSASIRRSSLPLLDSLAKIAAACPSAHIVIEGHTDSMGAADTNQRLSEARASSVQRYLADKGVVDERLRAVGRGETVPLADNTTSQGRARNRRIEIKVEGE